MADSEKFKVNLISVPKILTSPYHKKAGGLAQSVLRIAMGWTVQGSNPGG
jgi:hypothetical protein